MLISATIRTAMGQHDAQVETDGRTTSLTIPARLESAGSGVNGGELLFLALATCYGNDIFREAKLMELDVTSVEVTVEGEFGGRGEPAQRIGYQVRVEGHSSEAELTDLILHTDRVAEIQNTVRQGMPVTLETYEARTV